MPTYDVIYGGRQHIEAISTEEAYEKFWMWVVGQCQSGNFGLIVGAEDTAEHKEEVYQADNPNDNIFHQCRRGSHGDCIGDSRDLRRDRQLVACQCECHG